VARVIGKMRTPGALLIFAASACALGPAAVRAEPTPTTAATLSVIIPGWGQATQGDYTAAAQHFSLFAVSLGAGIHYQNKSDFLTDDIRYEDNREFINQTTLRRDFALRVATDTAFYSSFAAYREGRARDTQRTYRTPAPKESLWDLAVAPFSWQFLSRPTTFIPIGLQIWAAKRDNYGLFRDGVSQGEMHAYNFTANEFTAIGEEGFFRGFLNNEMSDRHGNGWGLVASSTIFGLAHAGGQGQTATVAQAALAGAYLGWVHQRNNFQIGEGVAIHYWINVIAGIASIKHGGTAQLVSFTVEF